MVGGSTNARRFINAYNNIDKTLRNINGFKANLPFTDVVRRCADTSQIIRKYEDELISFSRLRNAIIHNSYDNKIIAEPHEEIVEQIELIEKLISSPPPITAVAHKAVVFSHDINLKKAVKLMTAGGYSNIPIVKNGLILGVASNKLIVEAIAKAMSASLKLDEFFEKSDISVVLSKESEHFEIVPPTFLIDSALNLFHVNKKLRIILITESGADNGEILGVVTIDDLTKMSEIIFNL